MYGDMHVKVCSCTFRIPRAISGVFSHTLSSIGMAFLNEFTSFTGQRIHGVHLFLSPQCWDYRHTLLGQLLFTDWYLGYKIEVILFCTCKLCLHLRMCVICCTQQLEEGSNILELELRMFLHHRVVEDQTKVLCKNKSS